MKYNAPYGAPGSDDPYVNGDPSIARQGSILPAEAAEFPQRELVNFITDSDLIPDNNDLQQLTKSSRSQFVNFCVDSGAVNSLSVALVPALQAYKQGLPLRVVVANTNTGPTTINVNALGNRPVVRSNGAQLESGDIRAGQIALLVDDGTRFQVVNYLGAIGGITNTYTIHIPYAEDTSPTANAVVAAYTPVITSVTAGDVILVKVANRNTGAMTIAINALAAMPIRRNDGQNLQANDILAAECILIEYNTTYWQMLRLVRSQVYFKLSADLVLYVRTDGNDLNDGSINDATHAFRTIQAAVNYVKYSFLIAGRTVTIQLGIAGTYAGQVLIQDMPGSLIIRGDPNNMLGYVIQGPTYGTGAGQSTYPSTISVSGSGAKLDLTGVTISPLDTARNVVECTYGATLSIYDMAFSGVSVTSGLVASWGGHVTCGSYIHLYSNCGSMFGASQGASITIGLWFTLINVHGVTFSYSFCNAASNASINIAYGWCQFSGGGYGPRYRAYYNAAIVTSGGGPNYFPGNQAGAVDESSVYA
jgi:hypothetical protein